MGDLFDKEIEFEDYVYEKKLYKKLKVHRVERQKSPNGTKDRMDFLGFEKSNKRVIIELKHRDGDKRAVEQVLRYAGIEKKRGNNNFRRILVTGIVDLATSEAILGLEENDKKYFEWYVYKWDKLADKLTFERIHHDGIKKEITKMNKYS